MELGGTSSTAAAAMELAARASTVTRREAIVAAERARLLQLEQQLAAHQRELVQREKRHGHVVAMAAAAEDENRRTAANAPRWHGGAEAAPRSPPRSPSYTASTTASFALCCTCTPPTWSGTPTNSIAQRCEKAHVRWCALHSPRSIGRVVVEAADLEAAEVRREGRRGRRRAGVHQKH